MEDNSANPGRLKQSIKLCTFLGFAFKLATHRKAHLHHVPKSIFLERAIINTLFLFSLKHLLIYITKAKICRCDNIAIWARNSDVKVCFPN